MQTFRPFDFGSAKRNTLNLKNATRKHTGVDLEAMYQLDVFSTPKWICGRAEISTHVQAIASSLDQREIKSQKNWATNKNQTAPIKKELTKRKQTTPQNTNTVTHVGGEEKGNTIMQRYISARIMEFVSFL